MAFSFAKRAAVAIALLSIAGCTVHNTEAPATSGPSGLALTLTLSAIPDSISQDGGSQASIKVLAIGPNGKPVPALPMRVDMVVNGVPQDFGTLSARTIVTNTDGVATVVFTAPPSPPNGVFGTCAALPGTCVTILATPTGTNFQTSNSEGVTIRLVPPGVILPPASTPIAAFDWSPKPATANLPLTFDASTSQVGAGATQIASYSWTFGDGSTGTGKTVTHAFTAANTYNVTLTVTNDRNLSASTTQPVNVGAATMPTPLFTFSPSTPGVNEPVFFNASTSTAGPGHTITGYRWAFGDGATGSGSIVSHPYTTAGIYTVQLTVTDDAGLSVTSNGTAVTIGNPAAPTTNFTVSPAAPSVGDTVIFDYRSSGLVNGQKIVALDWNFGDGTAPVHCPGDAACAPDGITTHVFLRAGTFTVVLVTTDAAGRQGTKAAPVTVSAGGAGTPAAATFTFSPSAPGVNETVFFNASTSSAGSGHSIASYAWTFGDGGTASGVTTTHAYITAGTYAVQLRITDDVGQTTTSSATTITVGSPPSPTANFTFSPASPGRNDQVVFDASSSTTAQGQTIVDVAWNFGDGTAVIHCPGGVPADCPGPTNRISAHTFLTAQTFVVNLVVTDSAGRTGSKNAAVSVALAQPNVVITSSPTAPVSGGTVTFNSNGTTYFPGSGPGSFAWTFGDGSAPCSTAAPGGCGAGTPANPTHAYASPGTYSVGLSVTDNKGRTGTATATVNVASGNPTATLSVSKTGGLAVTADGSTSTATGSATITTYTFFWGDGTSTSGGASAAGHTYLVGGTYTITLRVTDSLGRTGTSTPQTVTVP